MKTYSDINELQNALLAERVALNKIAFVPTMGNLHEGHLSLVRRAQEEADCVVVSIFVNPLQFGPNEDLDKYPRTLAEDKRKLESCGVKFLFTPQVEDIYPEGMANHTVVSVPVVSEGHCGGSRPGHFDGVSTIVTKLFNIVQPDVAIFGEKDFQQLAVIRKMVNDLCMPLQIVGAPTCRAEDGLALSSRNQYLTGEQRQLAPALYQTLQHARQQLENGANPASVSDDAVKRLTDSGFRVDYFNISDARTLKAIGEKTREIVILAAAFLGQTRLIDNVSFPLNH